MQLQSICIPRLSASISNSYIIDIFEHITGIGSVKRIDRIYKYLHEDYNKVFVHFTETCIHTETTVKLMKRLTNNETIYIVYREPWFWKCYASKFNKPYSEKVV